LKKKRKRSVKKKNAERGGEQKIEKRSLEEKKD
jgi:hypothetical protein